MLVVIYCKNFQDVISRRFVSCKLVLIQELVIQTLEGIRLDRHFIQYIKVKYFA